MSVTHDPLCPMTRRIPRCNCTLIARVRADERRLAGERVRALDYDADLGFGAGTVFRSRAARAAGGEE